MNHTKIPAGLGIAALLVSGTLASRHAGEMVHGRNRASADTLTPSGLLISSYKRRTCRSSTATPRPCGSAASESTLTHWRRASAGQAAPASRAYSRFGCVSWTSNSSQRSRSGGLYCPRSSWTASCARHATTPRRIPWPIATAYRRSGSWPWTSDSSSLSVSWPRSRRSRHQSKENREWFAST